MRRPVGTATVMRLPFDSPARSGAYGRSCDSDPHWSPARVTDALARKALLVGACVNGALLTGAPLGSRPGVRGQLHPSEKMRTAYIIGCSVGAFADGFTLRTGSETNIPETAPSEDPGGLEPSAGRLAEMPCSEPTSARQLSETSRSDLERSEPLA